MSTVTVKWGKEVYTIAIADGDTVGSLRAQLEQRTGVPASKQKIMGARTGMLPPHSPADATLAQVGVTAGKTYMLLGSVDGTVIPTAAAATAPREGGRSGGDGGGGDGGGHAAHVAMSNGLTNIANTCYLNAAVQMLRLMPEVREVLAEYRGSNRLLRRLAELLRALDDTPDAVTPLALWTALLQHSPAFGERDEHGGFMQHDAQEVLSVLLQHVTEALPASHKHLFAGSVQQTLRCVDDPADNGDGAVSQQSFVMLACNIAGEVQTLEAGLQAAFDEHFTAPSARLQRSDAAFTRVSRLTTLPAYLFVHLVRFSWKSDVNKKAKILKPITFPLLLDVDMLVTPQLHASMQPVRTALLAKRDEAWARRRGAVRRGGAAAGDNNNNNTTAGARTSAQATTATPRNADRDGDASAQDNTTTTTATTTATTGATTSTAVATPPSAHTTTASSPLLQNDSAYYELCGVISHKGRSADGGHYVFWGKKADVWLVHDDEHVAAVSEEDVRRLRGVGEAHIAYILLYRSRDPLTQQPVIPL